MKNQNVLHVLNVSFVIPYFLGKQLLYMRKRGYEMNIICSPSSRLSALANTYVFNYKEVNIYRKFSLVADIKAILAICKYIKVHSITIVNGHTPKAGILAMFAAYVMRVPKRIYFRHGLLYETSTGIKKMIFLFSEKMASYLATEVVCVSPYLIEKSITDKLSSERKMHLLNRGSCNGVDAIEQFNPERIELLKLKYIRLKYGIQDGAWIIGYTGRMVKDKGIVELVEAYKILKSKFSNIYLLLVGPEEERDCLPAELVRFIHDDNNIIVTGLVNEDIEYYYALMNVLVLASFREGFGTSILEGSAMEIPILTTSHTGCRDAIIDSHTGFYIDHNPLSIVSKIEWLYENTSLAREMGINGRKFVMENFEQNIIWSEIEKLYFH